MADKESRAEHEFLGNLLTFPGNSKSPLLGLGSWSTGTAKDLHQMSEFWCGLEGVIPNYWVHLQHEQDCHRLEMVLY